MIRMVSHAASTRRKILCSNLSVYVRGCRRARRAADVPGRLYQAGSSHSMPNLCAAPALRPQPCRFSPPLPLPLCKKTKRLPAPTLDMAVSSSWSSASSSELPEPPSSSSPSSSSSELPPAESPSSSSESGMICKQRRNSSRGTHRWVHMWTCGTRMDQSVG